MNIISGTTIQEYNLFANRTPIKTSSASLSEETSVATILNLCRKLPLDLGQFIDAVVNLLLPLFQNFCLGRAKVGTK